MLYSIYAISPKNLYSPTYNFEIQFESTVILFKVSLLIQSRRHI